MKRQLLTMTMALLLTMGAAQAGSYDEALAAFGRGDQVSFIRWLRSGAAQGDARAQLALGIRYVNGDYGVEPDFDEARRWYRLAAAQGYAKAQLRLGETYDISTYSNGDDFEAIKWYRLAAAQGNADAQRHLGSIYDREPRPGQDDRKRVRPDAAESIKWYRLAAEQGDAYAQTMVSFAYTSGKGVPRDDVEAIKWIRLAAGQGDAFAQYSLGGEYEGGKGVSRDYVRADMWFNLSLTSWANQEFKHEATRGLYKSARDRVEEKMTPREITEALRLAEECQQRNFKNCD